MGKFIYNSSLPFVKNNYNGNRTEKDRFTNFPFVDPNPTLKKVLQWKMSSNPQKAQKKADSFKLDVEFMPSLPSSQDNFMIWLGHATFFIQYQGIKIITDPIFGGLPLIKRKAAFPLPVEELKGIDYILISHTHRDHFDKKSLKKLLEINPKAEVLGPLRMEGLMNSVKEGVKVQEAGWYQKFETRKEIKISFLPAVHWHRRTLFDFNKILWGSFLISGGPVSIFFAGDTGYDRHFQEIYDAVGKPDICLMPVGAYKPAEIMKSSHLTPEEAVKAFHILKGKHFIPMHYGTFDLSDEPLGEPVHRLRQMEEKNEIKGALTFLKPGEVYPLSAEKKV